MSKEKNPEVIKSNEETPKSSELKKEMNPNTIHVPDFQSNTSANNASGTSVESSASNSESATQHEQNSKEG
jgi:hypothetical protein